MKPIVHLLCKSLPQRCQIRNLQDIILNYCKQDDLVYDFMSKTVLCSILGAYSHSKSSLSWKSRIIVLRRLVYSPPNRTQMQEWLFGGYQHFLFYVIKEFLTYSIRLIPSLFEEIRDTYKWDAFESCVHNAMDNMRKFMENNIKKSTTISGWLEGIEPMLMQINKQQLGNLFRPQRMTFTNTILNLCERLDEQNNQAKPYIAFPREYRNLMRDMSKRIPRTPNVPVEWLTYFGVKNNAVESLKNIQKHYHQNTFRADVKKLLNDVSRYDFEAIRELFKIFYQVHHMVRVFPLPKHYYVSQIKALRRRYELKDGEYFSDNVGMVYACLACHTFKAFVVKSTDKISNLFANGHHKVIIDDETDSCSICHNKLPSNGTNRAIFDCGHKFHLTCVLHRASYYNLSCPSCVDNTLNKPSLGNDRMIAIQSNIEAKILARKIKPEEEKSFLSRWYQYLNPFKIEQESFKNYMNSGYPLSEIKKAGYHPADVNGDNKVDDEEKMRIVMEIVSYFMLEIIREMQSEIIYLFPIKSMPFVFTIFLNIL